MSREEQEYEASWESRREAERLEEFESGEILDEKGSRLAIGMRVGCRDHGEPREMSRRGLTLTGYEPGADKPYITNCGRFALALMDHQPEMDDWIATHVRIP